MIYPFICQSGHSFEVVRRVVDYSPREFCPECGQAGTRVFTAHQVHGSARVEDAEFNHGLGCVIKNRKHRAEIAKRKGAIEIGNESVESLHKEAEKTLQRNLDKPWESV